MVGDPGPGDVGDLLEERECFALPLAVVVDGPHVDRLALRLAAVLGRAHLDAEPAAGAVVGRDLHDVVEALQLGREAFAHMTEAIRCARDVARLEHLRADGRVRADHRAPVALHAEIRFPDRDLEGDAPLLVAARAGRPGPVGRERAHRQPVAVALQQQSGHALHEVGGVVGYRPTTPTGRVEIADGNLVQPCQRGVDGRDVAPHDLGSAPAPGVGHRLLHPFDRFASGKHAREREEAGRHDRVDAALEPVLVGDLIRVDREQPAPALDQGLLRVARKARPDPFGRDGGVDQHRGADVGHLQDVETVQEPRIVHGDEPGPGDLVGRADRAGTEPQVRHRG